MAQVNAQCSSNHVPSLRYATIRTKLNDMFPDFPKPSHDAPCANGGTALKMCRIKVSEEDLDHAKKW